MKKLMFTTLLLLAVTVATFAQSSFKLFRFTNLAQAELVLKSIGSEVKLTAAQTDQIRTLFTQNVTHQAEIFDKAENTQGDRYNMYMTRQTGHLEGNLRTILGEETYKQYEAAKPAIEAKVLASTKN